MLYYRLIANLDDVKIPGQNTGRGMWTEEGMKQALWKLKSKEMSM
jgi:hypothetical protein